MSACDSAAEFQFLHDVVLTDEEGAEADFDLDGDSDFEVYARYE